MMRLLVLLVALYASPGRCFVAPPRRAAAAVALRSSSNEALDVEYATNAKLADWLLSNADDAADGTATRNLAAELQATKDKDKFYGEEEDKLRDGAEGLDTKLNFNTVSPLEAKAMMDEQGAVCLDVRTGAEFVHCAPQGAINVPLMEAMGGKIRDNAHFAVQALEAVDPSKPVLVSCQAGRRSPAAAQKLLSAGYNDVYVIEGGLAAWVEEEDLEVAAAY